MVLVGLGLLTFEPSDASSPANPRFTAQLVESGPFTQTLPRSLKFEGLAPAGIGEPSSAQKLTATQVVISDTGESGLNMFVWAHVEIYPDESLARQRWSAKRHVLTQQYETGLDDLSEDSACVDEQMSWTCVATRGLAYAEVTLTPNGKLTLPTTTAVLQALLEYTDDQARQAS